MSECCERKPAGGTGTGTICCEGAGPAEASVPTAAVDPRTTAKYFGIGLSALGAWWLIYRGLSPFAKWVTFSLLTLTPGSHRTSAVEFFVFEAPKVLMLLTLVVFAVGIVRSFFTPERARRILAGKRESAGNVLASLLGVVTPFCSCSAVPLFIGFVTSGVPLGVTFSFLVSAPMVNEIALVLLYGLFGWKIAVLYAGTGLAIAMISGWVIGRLGMEKHVEEWVYAVPAGRDEGGEPPNVSWRDRVHFGFDSVRDIVGKVWPYVVVGIAVGAGIHGYVPENFMAGIMGAGAWWSVPLAVLDRDPHVFKCGRDHPYRAGPPGEGGGAGDGFGVHDVGDRPLPAGDDHPPEGSEGPPDRHLRRGRRSGNPDRRLPVQHPSVR